MEPSRRSRRLFAFPADPHEEAFSYAVDAWGPSQIVIRQRLESLPMMLGVIDAIRSRRTVDIHSTRVIESHQLTHPLAAERVRKPECAQFDCTTKE